MESNDAMSSIKTIDTSLNFVRCIFIQDKDGDYIAAGAIFRDKTTVLHRRDGSTTIYQSSDACEKSLEPEDWCTVRDIEVNDE
jgi:hypothetical protein